MGRIYSVAYTGTLTNAGGNTDLISIQPADDKPVKLRGILLSQISEVGDAAEEGLEITIKRLAATFTVGSGGSVVTPATTDSADTAAGCTTRCNDTTVSTSSGATTTSPCRSASWTATSGCLNGKSERTGRRAP